MAEYKLKYTGKQVDEGIDAALKAVRFNAQELAEEQQAQARENIGAASQKEVDELSEEMAGQTVPESYGAKGDGVTDDSAAIAQALASGKNVVFDGAKTYAVGSTITIPADAFVDFRGASIVPKGNHDVIRVMPGSHISNLIVRCTNVAGWDSAAMVFYAGDMFGAKNPTRISNVKMFNNMNFGDGKENLGIGLYLYADDFGQCIEGLSVADTSTCGFGRGVYIYGKDGVYENPGNPIFIGGNNFPGYWSFRDTYGIYIDAKMPNNLTTNNFFTDLNVQSDYYGGSVYAIYCNGFENYFSGCLYDYSILSYHPETAVFFAKGSAKNVVEVTAGYVNKAGYYVNEGSTSNKVIKRCFENEISVPYAEYDIGMIGNQDDALAFIDKRAECALESIDEEPYTGDLSCVFNPTPSKVLVYRSSSPESSKCRAAITINLKKVLRRPSHFILQFGLWTMPKSVKVTFYNSKEATVVYQTKNNANRLIVISPLMEEFDYILNVVKIVVELGDFNLINQTSSGGSYGEWSIDRIMAVDALNSGETWLRRDGGELFGNIKFGLEKGVVLTSENGNKYMLTVSNDGTLSTREYIEAEEEVPEAAVLTPVMAAGPTWFNADLAGTAQNTITSVVFNAAYEPTGNENASWACDEDGNGNIMAYRNGTEVIIKSTTGSEGVQLNMDSKYMFAANGNQANFTALASITGSETWSAGKDTECTGILIGNTVITNPTHVPDGVYNLNNAFKGCTALTTPPVLPEGVVAMNNCFENCYVMQYLPELPSTIQSIEYAFHVCKAATRAPSVIPAGAKKITAAFRNCWYLNGNIEVNAEAITSYSACFENTSRDGGAVTLTGSCPLLAELAATNTLGKVTVAS